MAFQFPLNPTVGQVFNPSAGVSYKWDGTGWAPVASGFLSQNDGDARYVRWATMWAVGDIYLSMSAVNPSTRFGGTWALVSQGRFLVGSDGPLGGIGAQGGEYAHTLTQAELPPMQFSGQTYGDNEDHSHGGGATGTGFNAGIALSAFFILTPGNTGGRSNQHTHNFVTNVLGGGQAHNIIPPYLVVYVWQRTA